MKELAPNVIMIPPKEETPQDQEHKRSLRVAAYCRVSTDNDEQLSSYENQRAYYTDKIMRESDWTMVDVFADEGKTGTSTCARKDFLRMIRQCRQGKIDMILTKSVSRFARNTVDTLKYTRELRNLGIPVIFEEQNINSIHPESEFLITIHGAFAQSESENTSSRVTWGKRQAMRSGNVTLQYKWLLGYERGPDGKTVIVPDQAETVRFIYRRYLAGDSLRTIKAALEEKGCLTATGKKEWVPARIQSILTNEKYCGDLIYQKTYCNNYLTHERRKNLGEVEQYLITEHHEKIIDKDLFMFVQMLLRKRRDDYDPRTGNKNATALAGLVYCATCGRLMRRILYYKGKPYERHVLTCKVDGRKNRNYSDCPQNETLDYQLVEDAAKSIVEERLGKLDMDLLLDTISK